MNPNNIPNLQWKLTDKLHTTGIGAVPKTQNVKTENINGIDEEVNIYCIFINICSYIKCKIDYNTYTTNTVNGSKMSIKPI